MLPDIDFPKSGEYRTGTENEPISFYMEGLLESTHLDLLLGYFSSSAISVLSLGFAKFLSNEGKVRLIINHILSEKDKNAIIEGNEAIDREYSLFNSDFNKLKESLDSYGEHFFRCIAWLISTKRIQIKSIRPKERGGISHYKSGIFSDSINEVKFKGSCNFTSSGLLENLEELDLKFSWKSDKEAIDAYKVDFSQIWNGEANYVEHVPFSDIETVICQHYGGKDLNELLIEEKTLLQQKKSKNLPNRIQKTIQKALIKIESYLTEPRFPYKSGPREYQQDAYQNWLKNNKQGIFAMATGTGKTITSLNCLLQETLQNEGYIYHCLILVPTITLVNQWEQEARNFNFQEIIKVSSKSQWESELATTLSTAKRIPISFIIITTYASFIKERFQKYVHKLPKDTLFIADEAHNIGSESVLKNLSTITLQNRIGLSATPKRIYDIEGSRAMEAFFNDKEPYTYSFSMERAIDEGILCKYYYYPHIVNLTADELEQYIEITKKLAKFFNKKSGSLDDNEIVQKLLLKRKRIIHKAANKLSKTRDILESRFRIEGNLKYTFIYVPEGNTKDIQEEDSDDDESLKIINQYTREIGRIDESIMINQFISGMNDRNEVLEQFKDGKIHVIASMKCLDEGVDIPRAEHAIFCSSTGNPRQFIQRRGRILRTHPRKDIAVIHDLIIVPDIQSSDSNSETFRVERSLVEKELERVMYFASLAINPYETENVFSKICEHYDLNIYTIHQKLKAQ